MNLRILIIEDDPVSQHVLQGILEDFGHCHLTSDGWEGLMAFQDALYDDKQFHLVVTDLRLAELNGLETILGIRSSERQSSAEPCKIIMVSSAAFFPHQDEFLLRTAPSAFMNKPIDRGELIKTMHKLNVL